MVLTKQREHSAKQSSTAANMPHVVDCGGGSRPGTDIATTTLGGVCSPERGWTGTPDTDLSHGSKEWSQQEAGTR